MRPRIVCAACKLPDGKLVVGPRHFDEIMCSQFKDLEQHPIVEQGFIDQFGKFYTREEAWKVAGDNGQILRIGGGEGGKLYSENLY